MRTCIAMVPRGTCSAVRPACTGATYRNTATGPSTPSVKCQNLQQPLLSPLGHRGQLRRHPPLQLLQQELLHQVLHLKMHLVVETTCTLPQRLAIRTYFALEVAGVSNSVPLVFIGTRGREDAIGSNSLCVKWENQRNQQPVQRPPPPPLPQRPQHDPRQPLEDPLQPLGDPRDPQPLKNHLPTKLKCPERVATRAHIMHIPSVRNSTCVLMVC